MDDDFSFDDHLDDVDLEIDIEMPETPAQRPKGRNSAQNTVSRPIIQSAKNNKKKSTDNGFIPDNDTINTKVQQKPGEGNDRTDPEEKLATEMKDSLAECSRQRLRSLHMYLRRFGNVDNRISEKDMLLAFQENSINLTLRLFQMVCELYGGPRGVDFERLYRFLLAAHDMTGRDSVKARRQRNDLEARANVSQEARDEDFLRRIEALLIRDQTFLDIENLRSEFQSMDSHRSGKISTSLVHSTCAEKTPLYGALLDNLVKRCQEDHDGQVSWPSLLNFLEKGQQNAQKKCPDLVALREKARALAAVNVAPDPMDELSSSAKSRFMTKFLRKQATHVRENTMSPTPPAAAATPDSVTERKQEDDHPTVPDLKPEGEPGTILTDEKRKISALGKPIPVLNGTKKKTLPVTRPKAKVLIAAKSTLPLIEVDKVSEGGTEASSIGAEDSAEKRKYESRKVSLNEETSKQASSSLDEGPHRHESNDTFAAQKKTSGEIETVTPKGYKEVKVPIDPPNERLQLDWVYGCRGNDCRRNLHVLVTGELAYFIANIVVLYNRAGHTQRHYREHNEDVKCMAVHSNGVTVASGQFSSKFKVDHLAHIRVWRSDLLQTLNVIGVGAFHKAVTCLAFQPNKDVLAAVDNAHEKHLTVWNIGSNEVIADGYIQTDTICDMEFNPKSPDFLVTSGKEHLTWWKFSCDVKRIQYYAHPDYETYMKAKYVICVTHTEKGDLLTGDSNGTVYVWGDGSNKITNFVKHGHDGPVLSLQLHHQYVISGGRDGMVFAWTWNKNMDKAAALTIPASEGGVRTLTLHNDTLVISTTMNSLLSVTMAQKGCPLDGVALDPVPLTQGHFDELRGLTVISKSFLRADVLTAGTDGVLCKFNTHKHGPVWKLHMKGVAFQCVDCTAKGDGMVLGTKDGHVLALELKKADMTVVEIMDTKVTTGRLDCIRLSPDKQWFAVGGQDSAIYLFRATQNTNNENGWELSGILKGHDGNITSMDWSSESVAGSLLLRTSSSVPEQKYWDVATATEVNGSQLDVIKWATDTCTLDHLVTEFLKTNDKQMIQSLQLNDGDYIILQFRANGRIWSSKQAIDGQVTCVDVNLTKSLVAMGNDQGFLSLFRFPCTQTGAFSHTYRCHQKIVSLRFSPAGDSILTIGGYDSALVQWKVV